MRHFLVVRNANKETTEIREYATMSAALSERGELREKNPGGEVVLAYAASLDELLACFSEYRMPTSKC